MARDIRKFLAAEEGATALEYALIAALISTAAISALQSMGESFSALYERLAALVAGSIAPGP